ncbi:type IV secretory system conjugative DNA transfer family protein [Halobaculum gomorrense]|uniref:ATP-binding protein n=1 Tax=Halobaculum gomorrense TaxID=43928 RepID=A0A1M5JBK2_9EURY|nr:ATP-binding protein [Halobaculum gomorrense]SHG37952.1 hypothetical protein SAMN05443636_0035 [Halobaculum gomorrense]
MGLRIGDTTPDDVTRRQAIEIPRTALPFHTLITGKTNTGKSVLGETMFTSAHKSMEGPRILIDGKGDGMSERIIRAVYASGAPLGSVVYIPVAEVLPAIPFFDISADLAAGLGRSRAIENRADRYLEVVRYLSSDVSFGKRTAPTIRALIRAQFDPAYGDNAFRHRDLFEEARAIQHGGAPPSVSSDRAARILEDLAQLDEDVREAVMTGVITVLEQVTGRVDLATVFNHLATDESTPQFRFDQILDTDATLLFDLGDVARETQRGLATVLLAELWFALKRRSRQLALDVDPGHVFLHIEEVANIALTPLLSTMLSEGRGYGLSIVSSMQFPGQAKHDSHAPDRLYHELVAESHAFVSGQVPDDPVLAKQLSVRSSSPAETQQVLSALSPGQWLFRAPPVEFDGRSASTVPMRSAPLPPGYPESDRPLSDAERSGLDQALDALVARTSNEIGIHPTAYEHVTTDESDTVSSSAPELVQAGTTLPVTPVLPDCVSYVADRDAIACGHPSCSQVYDPTYEGLRAAIRCHHSVADVSIESIPAIYASLKLSAEEIAATHVSVQQLLFLQVVLNATRMVYSPVEFDIVHNSMVQLRNYCGMSRGAVDELLEEGLLKRDDGLRETLYTVTADGRSLLNEHNREGVDHGNGYGDLDETATHRALVEALRRYIVREYKRSDDSPVDRVIPYYEPPGIDFRVDVAGLDADRNVVVVGEGECKNHDASEAAPRDFDKMSELDASEVLWAAVSRKAAHRAIIGPLSEPADGKPRIDESYSDRTPMRDVNDAIDCAGLTEVFTMKHLRDALGEPSLV